MTALRFAPLGVPVLVRSECDELRDRVGVAHASMEEHDEAEAKCLLASVRRHGDRWRLQVGDRPSVDAGDATSAARSLNHEIMHCVMLARPEHFYVHAGVVAVDGAAVILPGLSRAGKSTLVLALVAAGARFLSDELLVWSPDRRACLAFPRAIKIRDECVRYFPELGDRFTGSGETRFVVPEWLREDRLAESAPPRLVVVPKWGNEDRIATLARGRSLLALTRSALNFGTHEHRSIDHLADLAYATRAVSLTWKDPHVAATRIMNTCRETA